MANLIRLIPPVMRRVAGIVAEMNYAQRRIAVLTSAPDRYLPEQGNAPETYAEFLFRTAGPLRHEPSADRRAHGQLVR